MTRLLLALLAFYKRWLSPALHSLHPGGCKYLPTCSEYAAMAIATHGPVRGTALAAGRLCAAIPLRAVDSIPYLQPRPHPRTTRNIALQLLSLTNLCHSLYHR